MSRFKTARTREYGNVLVLNKGRAMPPEHIFLRLWHGVVTPVVEAFSADLYAEMHEKDPASFPDVAAIVNGEAGRLKHYDELTVVWNQGVVSSTRQQTMILLEIIRLLKEKRDMLLDKMSVSEYLDEWHKKNIYTSFLWVEDNLRFDMTMFFTDKCVRDGLDIIPHYMPKKWGKFIRSIRVFCDRDTEKKTLMQAEQSRIFNTIVSKNQFPVFDPAEIDTDLSAVNVLDKSDR